jgi:hypothetical protein
LFVSAFLTARPALDRPGTEANKGGCGANAPLDDDADDDNVQTGARVRWTPIAFSGEYYVQVVGAYARNVGPYTLTLSSAANFTAEEVQGECDAPCVLVEWAPSILSQSAHIQLTTLAPV